MRSAATGHLEDEEVRQILSGVKYTATCRLRSHIPNVYQFVMQHHAETVCKVGCPMASMLEVATRDVVGAFHHDISTRTSSA